MSDTTCRRCTEPATHGKLCERHARQVNETHSLWLQKHLAKGLCRYCSEPATHGRSCARHFEMLKEKQHRKRQERLAKGVCLSCLEPATHGRHCEKHAQQDRDKLKRRRADHVAAGLCVDCHAPATNGQRCARHAALLATYRDRATVKKKMGGICLQCRRPVTQGHLCDLHARRFRLHSRERRRRQRCSACGESLATMRRAFRQAPPYIRDQVHRQLEQTRYQRLLRSRYPWVIAFRHDSTLTCIYCLGGKPGLRLLVERKAWPMIQAAGDPDKMPPGCDDREDEKNAWSAQADLNAEAFYDWERRDHLSHEEPSCQTEVVRFSEPRLGEPLEFGAVVFDVPEDPSEYDELDERLRLSY